ncbi:uncharacterized protein RB166_007383 [Leptodactylus fuscus]
MALGKICITQEPNIINISQGDTARMSCQWNSQDSNRVRVQWRKQASSTEEANGTLLCSVLGTESSNHSEVRNNTMTCSVAYNTSLLTIAEVTMDDGGLYVCDVTKEIPRLKRAKGNGTQVLVYVRDGNSGFISDIRFLYLTILLIIPIFLSVYCLYCKRKKKKERFLDHIYGNVKRNTSKPSNKTTCKKKDTKKMSS